MRQAPTSTLFPYTTLFRSLVVDRRLDERADVVEQAALVQVGVVVVDLARALRREDHEAVLRVDLREELVDGRVDDALAARSEEHTSELQSQFHLVCRLLLE